MTILNTSLDVLDGTAAEQEVTTSAWNRPRRPQHSLTESDVTEFYQLTESAFSGNRHAMVDLTESLATSDFRFLFGQILDEQLLERYSDIPATWDRIARRVTVNNFKPKSYVDLLGGRGLLEKVAQLAPYPERSPSEAKTSFRVEKMGARISLAWEMLVNDDLDAFRSLPDDLAVSARDTEQATVTGLLVNETGLNGAYFKAGNKNLMAGNPALTPQSLQDAITAISTKVDSQGRPIIVTTAVLTVPPSLAVEARRILGAREIRTTDADGVVYVGENYLTGLVEINVDPWLTVINRSANAATTWFLTPATTGSRPSFVLGFLAGHETPELRVKNDQGNALGGGAIAPEQGSFDDDGIAYRVRHILGGGAVDLIATAASTGAGS